MNDIQVATLYDPLVVKERFIASVKQTLSNSPEIEHIQAKLLDLLGTRSPALFASQDALVELSQAIFADELFRGWVFDTKFVFFMNIAGGFGMQTLKALIQDLALAASENMGIDNEVGFLSDVELQASRSAHAMSQDLIDELPTDSAVKTVLTVNTWMIVIMLVFAFMDLDSDLLKNPAAAVTPNRKQVATS